MNTGYCAKCGKSLSHKRSDAKYCTKNCRIHSLKRKDKRIGVYFLKEIDTNFYKIGKTIAFYSRLKDIQAGNPRELILVHFVESKEPFIIEAFHHMKFKALHVKNEWYADDGSINEYLTKLKMSV